MTRAPHKQYIIILCLLPAACATQPPNPYDTNTLYQVTTDKPFKEVLDDAIFAIGEYNFRLAEHLRIGKAIQTRGYPEFPDYEVLLFCNLEYTRKILTLDPTMIHFCPGRINIRRNNNRVIVTAILWQMKITPPALTAHIQKLNALTREIVNYAADDWSVVSDRNPSDLE